MELLSAAFSNIWSIFLVVMFFGGSIFVHELGHFLAARRRGVLVERFSIGFGPAIWSHRAKDGVEYRIAWFPLGGYVLLPQLADLGHIEGESSADVAKLPPISYSTRMLVFVAGAAFNVLFAFVLACIITVVGLPESSMTATTRIGYVAKTLEGPDGVKSPSPALQAGFRAGDIVRAIDGKTVVDWQDLMQTLVTTTGRTARHAVDHQRRRHIVDGVEFRQQVVELIDEAQLHPPRQRSRIIRHRQRVLPVEQHLPPIGFLKQTCHVQQRRLSGTRRTDQPGHLAGTQVEIDSAQHMQNLVARLVLALDVLQRQHGLHRGRRLHHHSNLSASTGLSRAAQRDGMTDIRSVTTKAAPPTLATSAHSSFAGSASSW